jgi:hypothetical protein
LENSAFGGESIFADSFSAVSRLDKKATLALENSIISYKYDNDGHYMEYKRPIIVKNDPNEELKVCPDNAGFLLPAISGNVSQHTRRRFVLCGICSI